MNNDYYYLEDVIDFEHYLPDFAFNYVKFEDLIIRPKLEEEGYYGINFHPSEANMFGPNTRVITCLDQDGEFCSFVYN